MHTNDQRTVDNLQWRKLWKLNIPPKIRVFGWKLMHQCLPIGETLLKRHIHTQGNCPLGCPETETYDHLFLKCPFSCAVWFGLNITIRTSFILEGIIQWLKTLINNCHNQDHNLENNKIAAEVLWTCWTIYNQRNAHCFRGEEASPGNTLHIINNMLLQHRLGIINDSNQTRRRDSIITANIDYVDWLLDFINCKRSGKIIVCCFRDTNPHNPFFGECHKQDLGIDTATLLTIRSMLDRLCSLNRGIHVFGIPRRRLVDILHGNNNLHPTMQVIYEDIRKLCLSFISVNFVYCQFSLGDQIRAAISKLPVGNFLFNPL